MGTNSERRYGRASLSGLRGGIQSDQTLRPGFGPARRHILGSREEKKVTLNKKYPLIQEIASEVSDRRIEIRISPHGELVSTEVRLLGTYVTYTRAQFWFPAEVEKQTIRRRILVTKRTGMSEGDWNKLTMKLVGRTSTDPVVIGETEFDADLAREIEMQKKAHAVIRKNQTINTDTFNAYLNAHKESDVVIFSETDRMLVITMLLFRAGVEWNPGPTFDEFVDRWKEAGTRSQPLQFDRVLRLLGIELRRCGYGDFECEDDFWLHIVEDGEALIEALDVDELVQIFVSRVQIKIALGDTSMNKQLSAKLDGKLGRIISYITEMGEGKSAPIKSLVFNQVTLQMCDQPTLKFHSSGPQHQQIHTAEVTLYGIRGSGAGKQVSGAEATAWLDWYNKAKKALKPLQTKLVGVTSPVTVGGGRGIIFGAYSFVALNPVPILRGDTGTLAIKYSLSYTGGIPGVADYTAYFSLWLCDVTNGPGPINDTGGSWQTFDSVYSTRLASYAWTTKTSTNPIISVYPEVTIDPIPLLIKQGVDYELYVSTASTQPGNADSGSFSIQVMLYNSSASNHKGDGPVYELIQELLSKRPDINIFTVLYYLDEESANIQPFLGDGMERLTQEGISQVREQDASEQVTRETRQGGERKDRETKGERKDKVDEPDNNKEKIPIEMGEDQKARRLQVVIDRIRKKCSYDPNLLLRWYWIQDRKKLRCQEGIFSNDLGRD